MAGLAGFHEILGGLVVVAFIITAILAAIAAAGRDERWVRTVSFVAAGLLALQYVVGVLLLANGSRNSNEHYVIGLLVLVPVALQHSSARRLSSQTRGVAFDLVAGSRVSGGYRVSGRDGRSRRRHVVTVNGPTPFLERLRHGPPLLLDAAMGSDLDRRGLATTLPLWSARGLLERPELVRQIHLDNLLAGADIITTDTFRTTARTLRKTGLDPARAAELDVLAMRLAQEARAASGRPHAFIAGSIAPLEDCYLPTFDTPPRIALVEHRAQARNLAAAGVDLLMVETMPTATEAGIALQAATETGLPATIGFVCAVPEPGNPVHLLSGETLADAVALVEPRGPAVIFVNCAAPDVITAALKELRTLTDTTFGAYANVGQVDDQVGWSPDGRVSAGQYAEHAREWLALGAQIVGGCCGTHPLHTAAVRRMMDDLSVLDAQLVSF